MANCFFYQFLPQNESLKTVGNWTSCYVCGALSPRIGEFVFLYLELTFLYSQSTTTIHLKRTTKTPEDKRWTLGIGGIVVFVLVISIIAIVIMRCMKNDFNITKSTRNLWAFLNGQKRIYKNMIRWRMIDGDRVCVAPSAKRPPTYHHAHAKIAWHNFSEYA